MVTDKDMSEIAAEKEIFPAAKQFVCVFHSLQAVKRRFSTARLLTDYFKEKLENCFMKPSTLLMHIALAR